MKGCLLVLFGLVGGLILGGVAGVIVGSICVEVFHVSEFEGGAGMMVFFTFMPLGAIAGAIAGGVLLGRVAAKR